MKTNVGTVDRTLRIVGGLALLSLFFFLEGPARSWSLVGLVMLGTGLSGFCPLYTLLGFSSCSNSK
jgi:hypothetical protein